MRLQYISIMLCLTKHSLVQHYPRERRQSGYQGITNNMIVFNDIGIAVPEILFPKKGTDLTKWATIACDQFTSQPEYWDEVSKTVGDAPSTLNMQMPEAWLAEKANKSLGLSDISEASGAAKKHISHESAIPETMERYLSDGTLTELPEGFIFIKRQTSAGTRRGLLALFDLEKYEWRPGNKALIRATERTVESRLPVRVDIRRNAPLEMPHAMILINDPKDSLMGSLEFLTRNRRPFYDFDLMQDSGNIRGWLITAQNEWNIINDCLTGLKDEAEDGLLFAVGDGNHSLAAAKLCWEEEKIRCGLKASGAGLMAEKKAAYTAHQPDIRRRYVLAELVNLYDPAIVFEPIHRIVKDGEVLDYIHGEAACIKLAEKLGCEAKLMPPYPKDRMFKDVIENGVLPEKTFSLGNGPDKRFYLECRKL